MTQRLSLPVLAVSVVLLASSCSKFASIQKSNNVDLKYKAAIRYFDKKDYFKASTLFEEMLSLLKGRAEGEKAQFFLAYCQFHQGQFVLSAYSFKKFNEQYGRSELAEEALYLHCLSLYEDSPDYELDQTNTKEALESIQHFFEHYPKSRHVNDCNNMVDDLTYKLENKAYKQAKLYHDIGYFKASVVSFDNMVKDFPSSKYVEECTYLKIEAQYKYAHGSIETKRKERYQSVIEYYLAFLDKYPGSKYLTEAENIYGTTLKEMDEMENPVKAKGFWSFLSF